MPATFTRMSGVPAASTAGGPSFLLFVLQTCYLRLQLADVIFGVFVDLGLGYLGFHLLDRVFDGRHQRSPLGMYLGPDDCEALEMSMFLLCAGRFNNGHHYMIIGARIAWVTGWGNDQHRLSEN